MDYKKQLAALLTDQQAAYLVDFLKKYPKAIDKLKQNENLIGGFCK